MDDNITETSESLTKENQPPKRNSLLKPRYINNKLRVIIVVYALLIFVTSIISICLLIALQTRLDHLERLGEVITNNTRTARDAELVDELQHDNSTAAEDNGNYFKIIERTKWGAAESSGQLNRFNRPIGTVIIAHTDTHECIDFESCKFQLTMLQLFFKQLRNFEDIGYNFLIGGDGAVYEGIGWECIGYHTKGHNDNSIGIGFIGNYQHKKPTENQLSAAILLLNYGLQNNYLDKNYEIKGQRDFLPLVSPGNHIYDHIKTWDHFKKKN